jgi:hypothetical protein
MYSYDDKYQPLNTTIIVPANLTRAEYSAVIQWEIALHNGISHISGIFNFGHPSLKSTSSFFAVFI